MSSRWGCEEELRKVAEKLHAYAYDLEKAADALELIRKTDSLKDERARAISWAKGWMPK